MVEDFGADCVAVTNHPSSDMGVRSVHKGEGHDDLDDEDYGIPPA